MIERRLERFARLFTTGRPRRTFAAGMPAAPAGRNPDRAAAREEVAKQRDNETDCCHGSRLHHAPRVRQIGRDDGDGDGACIDASRDPANCGGCALPCGSGKSCCAGVCVDLQLNLRHCGACGVACDRGELCRRGFCARRQGAAGGRTDRGNGADSRNGGIRWTSG